MSGLPSQGGGGPKELRHIKISDQPIRVKISDQPIDVNISGQQVEISGQPVTVSGNIVQISGQAVVTDSGSVTSVSGNIVQISGETVKISGETVKISGETVFIISGQILIDANQLSNATVVSGIKSFQGSGNQILPVLAMGYDNTSGVQAYRAIFVDDEGAQFVTTHSGDYVVISGTVFTSVSGNIVQISGQAVKISGETVFIISGRILIDANQLSNATVVSGIKSFQGSGNQILPVLAMGYDNTSGVQAYRAIFVDDEGSQFVTTHSGEYVVISGTVFTSMSGNAVTVSGNIVSVVGNVAAGATDTGNPVKIGGLAKTTLPTPVTDGQRVDALFSEHGKLIVLLNNYRNNITQNRVTIASSNAETTILTAISGVLLDLTSLDITNSTATAGTVTIRDATAGTARAIYNLASNGGIIKIWPVPFKQTTAANNWTATVSTSTVAVDIVVQAMNET